MGAQQNHGKFAFSKESKGRGREKDRKIGGRRQILLQSLALLLYSISGDSGSQDKKPKLM
jgi:hypothetical protein